MGRFLCIVKQGGQEINPNQGHFTFENIETRDFPEVLKTTI